MREELRTGLDALAATTELLQRVRNSHPIEGLYEAAEPQWWWSIPRSTDSLPQLFWFDENGPAASFMAADFGNKSSAVYEETTVVATVLPGSEPDWIAQVVDRGLAHAIEHGITGFEIEVDRGDEVMQRVLAGHDFAMKGEGIIECWLEAEDRQEISPLHDGYTLRTRAEVLDAGDRPHHMADSRRPDVEERLQQTSLYRSDLDLVVYADNDEVAAYGLFWLDPVSETGVVEPMRTQDEHQQRGLGRHILTAGIDRLAQAGAKRISIGFEPDNPASGHLYTSVGFESHQHTHVWSRSSQVD